MADLQGEAATLERQLAAFFGALALRDLARCDAILGELSALPGAAPWRLYLAALLANERDQDYGRAEALLAELLAGPLPDALIARAHLAIGRTYDYQGRWAEAIAAYERCLPLFAAQDSAVDQAKAWKQIAIAYRNGFAQGDFGPEALARAEGFCQQALAALGPAEGADDDRAWLIGSVWNTLGAINMNRGRWDEAIACYQRDMAIGTALGDTYGRGVSLLNLGEIFHGLGQARWDEAATAYAEALPILRAYGDQLLEADLLANQAALLRDRGDGPGATATYAEAVGVIEAVRAGVSSEAARAAFFATTADTYANAVLHCLAQGEVAAAFDYTERARSRAFLDSLAAGSTALAESFVAAPLNLAEVQHALPPGALLLAFFTTGLVEARQNRPGAERTHRHRFPAAHTLLFAVTADSVSAHTLGLGPNELLPATLDSVVERHFLRPELRRALFERLLAPVAAGLRQASRLYIVPHGPLHYIPFLALLDADEATLLWAGSPALVYGPSATVLFQEERLPDRPAPRRSLLALGVNGTGPGQLRYAEEEARAVARICGGDAMTGSEVALETLFARAGDYARIHFSCHGAFDPERPLSSALQLGPGAELTALAVIEGLRLRCELVTLSACESGLSLVRRGDELMGLVRAFRYAGAGAVLCTLWRVDERATRVLMELFYRRVQGGQGLAAALRDAQLELRSLPRRAVRELLLAGLTSDWLLARPKHSDEAPGPATLLAHGSDDDPPFAAPFYWAPFVLVAGRTARL